MIRRTIDRLRLRAEKKRIEKEHRLIEQLKRLKAANETNEKLFAIEKAIAQEKKKITKYKQGIL